MPSGRPIPVTPLQLAKNGHVATMLREYMARNNVEQPHQLLKLLGMHERQSGMLYKWINAKASPGPKFRVRVAKLLGVKPHEVEARYAHDGAPATGLPVPYQQQVSNPLAPIRKTASDALQFNVDSDGEARLRLDVKLPLAQGTALLRLILDANVLLASPEEDTA